MYFELFGHTFSIGELIDAKRNDSIVARLIEVVSQNDASYILHEPLAEDIVNSKDRWSCHIAEEAGITFEFSNERLCYIALRFSPEELQVSPILHISDEIINIIVDINEHYTEYAFGSVKILSNEDLIPNRWSPIMDSLLIGLSLYLEGE